MKQKRKELESPNITTYMYNEVLMDSLHEYFRVMSALWRGQGEDSDFLENSFKGENSFWRYLVMIVVIFAATNTIGALPFLIAGLSDSNILHGANKNFTLSLMLFPFIVGLAT
jgi:hypothetical protein